MQFRSELNRPIPHQYAMTGFKKYLDIYEEVIDNKTGKMVLKITDKEPIDDKIQEAKDSVSLDKILDKYKIDLSKTVIKEISEDILDMTMMPTDALEAYSLIEEAKKNFEETTSDFKKEFNNNFGEYVAGFKNGKTQEIINKHNKHLVEKIKEATNPGTVNPGTANPGTANPGIEQNVQPATQNTVVGGQTYNV